MVANIKNENHFNQTLEVIIHNEEWLHAVSVKSTLQEAMNWAVANPAKETRFSELEALVNGK